MKGYGVADSTEKRTLPHWHEPSSSIGSVERVPEVELPSACGVVDARDALVLGREALALARVVLGAMIAGGCRIERQVVRAPRPVRPVGPRAVRDPGVEHDGGAGLRQQAIDLPALHDAGAQGPVGVLRQCLAVALPARHL